MATSFPAGLDALNNPASTGHNLDTAGVLHSDQHANANDAIEALEAKVGVDGSAVTTSLDYLAKVALPKGVLGYAQVTADQTGVVAEVDATGLSVGVTTGTSRRVRISFDTWVENSVADGEVAVRIKEGGTELKRGLATPGPAGRFVSLGCSVVIAPTAGVHTYKLTIQANSGVAALRAGASSPTFILIEDLGKA